MLLSLIYETRSTPKTARSCDIVNGGLGTYPTCIAGISDSVSNCP
jgi:hypothetical protein